MSTVVVHLTVQFDDAERSPEDLAEALAKYLVRHPPDLGPFAYRGLVVSHGPALTLRAPGGDA